MSSVSIHQLNKNTEKSKMNMSKIMKVLSKFYLLPMNIDYEKSEMTFSFLSLKTFVNFILYMTPFIIEYVLIVIQFDYFIDASKVFPEVYHTIDMIAMLIYPTIAMLPFPIILIWMISYLWTRCSYLTLNTDVQLPRNWMKFVFSVILQIFR